MNTTLDTDTTWTRTRDTANFQKVGRGQGGTITFYYNICAYE